MKTPQQTLGEVVLGLIVLLFILLIVWFFGRGLINTIQAPAKLESALGSNAALVEGAKKNNEAVKARGAESQRRRAESKAAVAKAGTKEAAQAEAILSAPCSWGKTDYECANGRFDRELNLQ